MNQLRPNPKEDLYKEEHHIVPKCLGGSNDTNNLVMLTARQHYLAHWLLYKIHKTPKLVHAWFGMCRIGIGQESRKQNSHLFEYAKKERSRILSESSKGEKNWFYGKKHTKESINKLLTTRSKTYSEDPERHKRQLKAFAAGVSKRWKGVPKTPESNLKRSRPGLMMLKNKVTGECIKIPKEDCFKYSEDWGNPYALREKKYGKCPYCGKENDLNSTFKRWHFENCKENI